jgi:hypothetical protein
VVLTVSAAALGACAEEDQGLPPTPTADVGTAEIGSPRFVLESFATDGPLTAVPGEVVWVSASAGWAVADGQVAIADVGASPVLAVTDLGWSDGAFSVSFPVVAEGAGLVFRYVDVGNYWVVRAAPAYATWNLERVVDGEVTVVGNTGLSAVDAATSVGVVAAGDAIVVLVNGRPLARTTDPTHATGTWMGFYATGVPASAARWDDLLALPSPGLRGGAAAFPTPTPLPTVDPTPTPTTLVRIELDLPTPTPVAGG